MTDGEEWLKGILKETQLESFHSKLTHQLQITRPSHFEYVQTEDLLGIGMSRPSIRRLQEAFKKLYGKKSLFTKIFTSNKTPLPTLPTNDHVTPASDDVKCLINLNDLHFVSTLGSGSFGVVRKAIWMTSLVNKVAVAVKVLRSSEGWEFVREVNLMHSIQHPHLITLHGVVLDNPPLMVTELAALGSLLNYIREHNLLISTIHLFLHQICLGMMYLESRSLIHRDLAARNILLSAPTIVKIGDFGLTRSLKDEDIYVTDEKQRMPFAWCAPESMHSRMFSHKSDVWMVGVVAWELYSSGGEPWTGLNGGQVLAQLEKGNRLQKPILCSERVFEGIMNRCWQQQAELRPSFKQLIDLLSQMTPRDLVVRVDGEGEVAAFLIETGRDICNVQLKSTAEVIEVQCTDVVNNNKNKKNNKKIEISEPLRDTLKHTGHSDGVGKVWGDPGSIDGHNNNLLRRATLPDILPISTQQSIKEKMNKKREKKNNLKHTSLDVSKRVVTHSLNPTLNRNSRPPLKKISHQPIIRSQSQTFKQQSALTSTNPYFPKRPSSPAYSSTYQSIHSISPPTSPSYLYPNPFNDGYLLPEDKKVILRSKQVDALALFDSSIEPSILLPPPTIPNKPPDFSTINDIFSLIPPHSNQIMKPSFENPAQNSFHSQNSFQSSLDPSTVDYSKLSDLFNDDNLKSSSILTPEVFPTFCPKSPPTKLIPTFKSPPTKLIPTSKSPPTNLISISKSLSTNLISVPKSPPIQSKSDFFSFSNGNATKIKRSPSNTSLTHNTITPTKSTSTSTPSQVTKNKLNNITQKPKITFLQKTSQNPLIKTCTKKTILLPINGHKTLDSEDVYCNQEEIQNSSNHNNHIKRQNGTSTNQKHKNKDEYFLNDRQKDDNLIHKNDHINEVYANHEDIVSLKSSKTKSQKSTFSSSKQQPHLCTKRSTNPSTHMPTNSSTHTHTHTSTHTPTHTSDQTLTHTPTNTYTHPPTHPSMTLSSSSSSQATKRSKKDKNKMVDELVQVMGEMAVVGRHEAHQALLTCAYNATEALKLLKEYRLHRMGLVSLKRCRSILQTHNYDLPAALHSITHSSSV